MNKSRTTLILRGLLWLIERERAKDRSKPSPYIEEQDTEESALVGEIRAVLEEDETDTVAIEKLRAARESEHAPVQEGKMKEKEHGGEGAAG
jgi:hypothetical protein